ncbi:Soluble aldose sugar dehydrogenase YliI precursor [Thalassoglobus neptunius]|uniref:Soluble aldose sugar dehydrogenase YliI n=1 Tax=Thalassoglobus neptunius TaxID=1938619 RepID=A0A5C5VRI4_9PLAN|nr:family 16 glycoside hydrolase [Thalassoglobus neptunius]TWT40182.1 Soluble aldose sugar dehydrogenase YliI precursor [Thalassoglobus neptunius]
MKQTVFCAALAGVFSVTSLFAAGPNQLTEAEKRSGWELLFDGTSTENFRNYQKDTISDGWVVEDGALIRKEKGAGDIITKNKYSAFELMLDYKISPGGNSGLMFLVTEEYPTPWRSGPEIQIQDNVDGHDAQKAGWLYQLYQPPNDPETGKPLDATRPAGEWNQLHVIIDPKQSEINMNGVRYVRFQVGSDDWNKKVAASKFAPFENFGKAKEGHIALQDHGNEVAFRNIKIRDLGQDNAVKNPVDSELGVKPKLAFPNLTWKNWEPVDEKGRPQSFRPIVVTHANDGSGRLFVMEQHGVIYSFENKPDVTESNVFLDLRESVKYADRQNEEGFLGMAFHPKYKENGEFFVYYTEVPGQVSVISRFNVSADDPNKADPDSELEIMRIEQPFWNHNGGTIAFGPDGYLYVGLGDGGSANDPFNNAQNLSSLLGSILRIDIDSTQDGKNYAIPEDNPFIRDREARPEIYAYGLRNVWRMSFDRESGDLWCADVGQNLWEEINIIVKGGNYGWNLKEGTHPFGSSSALNTQVIDPIWEYDHGVGKSITGGTVYRGSRLPSLNGKYIYADYVSGLIWALNYDSTQKKVVSNDSIPSPQMPVITFGEDAEGEIYFCIVTNDGNGIYTFVAE